MTRARSAGILLYRRHGDQLEVLIAHMGGPFWARKDDGAWSIPKGEYPETEDPLTAAKREFGEELGSPAPAAHYELLGEFRQSSGKVITAFVAEKDFAVDRIVSNTFPLEWPPRSGQIQEFPEIDRAEWMSIEVARRKLVKGQVPLLDALLTHVAAAR
jgi:predicted NUDIX family NTP pyrophosphohydrolase